MPRGPRNMNANGFYHITSRGNKKAEIFHDTSDYEMFMRLLLRCRCEFSTSIFHYMLMPNHIHLEMRPNNDLSSKFMQKLKSIYAMYYGAKYGTVGHVWEGRFKSKHITTDAHLLACGNYIEMNPVRARLARHPGDWPYSSYHFYAKGANDQIVEQNLLYGSFGISDEIRRTTYAKQVATTRSI